MGSIAYTLKEVNAIAGCNVFTVAGICSPSQVPMVRDVWTKAFNLTDVLYCGDETITTRGMLNSQYNCWLITILPRIDSPLEL